MRSILFFLILFTVSGFYSTNQIVAQDNDQQLQFVSVDSNQFINEDGQVVTFRGVSFSDPDHLEKMGHWNKEYFQAAKNWSANLVRFPVHPSKWRDRGQEDYLNLLDQGIEWAGELGMYVIIDWHVIGNIRTEIYLNDSYYTSFTETMQFWKVIAERYVDNPVVAFYEVYNEPTSSHGRFGELTWAQLKEVAEEIIHLIYAHDKKVIPLVSGLNFGYDLSDVLADPVDFPGVAYVAHPYPQKRSQPWEEQWEADWGQVADKYPMVATEFGFMSADDPGAHRPCIGDEVYGEAIINYFSQKGISWTAWVFDPGWYPVLIRSWDFEPSRQGKFFRNKMIELNASQVKEK